MKWDEGHRGGFSPRDPPLATGRKLSDEPGRVLGCPSLLPHWHGLPVGHCTLYNPARSVPQFTLGGEEGRARGAD